jgi:hypothetical protein
MCFYYAVFLKKILISYWCMFFKPAVAQLLPSESANINVVAKETGMSLRRHWNDGVKMSSSCTSECEHVTAGASLEAAVAATSIVDARRYWEDDLRVLLIPSN